MVLSRLYVNCLAELNIWTVKMIETEVGKPEKPIKENYPPSIIWFDLERVSPIDVTRIAG